MNSRETFACCSKCGGTFEIEVAVVEHQTMVETGLVLVDGAWTGLCPRCELVQIHESNAEYQALARAAAQIGRIDKAGPLSEIRIPPREGFAHEGETRFGFWATSHGWTDTSFERFRRTAVAIVGTLNDDRGVGLVVNVNAAGTQVIVHGATD